jgi:hypothetical protein
MPAVRQRRSGESHSAQTENRRLVEKPKPWTAEDERQLAEMRAAGVEWRVMANKLGRTVAACEGRLAKLRKASDG